MKKTIGIIAFAAVLLSVLCLFASCYRVPPENMMFPSGDCVMVYTISDEEFIRILYDPDSDFHLYGEWIKSDKATPVYLIEEAVPSMFAFGDGPYTVSIETFDPDEKIHVHTGECNHSWKFDKGALNSSEIKNPATGEVIPVTYSSENDEEYLPGWVSDVLLSFMKPDGKLYREETLHFWYDFDAQKGEWLTNGAVISIRMEFSGISPSDVRLRIYDISGEREKEILCARGTLADKSTFVSQELSGTMFYEGTVSEITVVKTEEPESGR